jgi:hypothetical protein
MEKRWFIKSLIASVCALSATANADKLCLKTTVNKKTLKVTNQSVVAAKCPTGYTVIGDTTSFVGPAGLTGSTGSAGATGPKGDRGESTIDILDSGQTISGSIVATGSGCGTYTASISFPAAAPLGLTQDDVIIVEPPLSECNPCLSWGVPLSNCDPCIQSAFTVNANLCTGNANFPTAPPGKVCVYFKPGFLRVSNMGAYTTGRFGFSLRADRQSYMGGCSESARYEAVWAYHAP